MEYFTTLKRMTEFAEVRQKQLEMQRTIDEGLSSLHCRDVVAQYLLYQRVLNRKYTKEYEKISLWNYPTLIEEHLEKTGEELERIRGLLTGTPLKSKRIICHRLFIRIFKESRSSLLTRLSASSRSP